MPGFMRGMSPLQTLTADSDSSVLGGGGKFNKGKVWEECEVTLSERRCELKSKLA